MTTSDGIRRGERLARLQGRLELLLRHLSGPAVRARVAVEYLVQEVYLRALSPGLAFPRETPDEAELMRLLRSLARHTVVDVVRAIRAVKRDRVELRLGRSSWSKTGLGAATPHDPGPGPRTRVEGQEAQGRLSRAFDGLSAEHRRVIGLHQVEGLGTRRTAGRMRRSEKAVHSLYRRALEAWEERAGAR